MIQENIKKISESDADYPEGLIHIHKAPKEIFLKGTILPQDREAIAIVGTRRATEYGLKQADKIAFELALLGITIVSGMAKGIDTAAHNGALRAGGRTIAVLGSGHNYIYPKENIELYHRITKNGAVVSEYSSDVEPCRENFPMRNRIISGMSKGVVVIEAPKRSGALITANYALEQGREVFAVPGNIGRVESTGTNSLIKQGASLVESVSDIIDELRYVMDLSGMTVSTEGVTFEKPKPPMSSDEKKVFEILRETPRSIDEISDTTEIPSNKVSQILLNLELKKIIKMLPGNNFARV